MSYTIRVTNGLVTMGEDSFRCPICTCPHRAEDWEEKYYKSKTGYITLKCRGCKKKLELILNIKCDVVVWEWKKDYGYE